MSNSRRVLLVCTGNTCRSPMGQVLLKKIRPEWEVQSAGIMAEPGDPASGHSRTVAHGRGLSLEEHRSQRLSQELVDWADVILCMGQSHRRALLQLFPGAAEKTRTLRSTDISDPVGQGLSIYETCAREIEEALEAYAGSA